MNFKHVLPALLLMFAGCSGILSSDRWEREIGLIDAEANYFVPVTEIPAMVVVGEPFDVTVTTIGSGSCTRADGARVEVVGSTAIITPYDRQRTGNVACTSDMASFPRKVTITFEESGEGVIRVLGRTIDDGGAASYEVQVEVAIPLIWKKPQPS